MVSCRRLAVSLKYPGVPHDSTLSRNQKTMWILCGHHRASPTSLGLAEEERVHVVHLHFHFSLEQWAEPEHEQLIVNLTSIDLAVPRSVANAKRAGDPTRNEGGVGSNRIVPVNRRTRPSFVDGTPSRTSREVMSIAAICSSACGSHCVLSIPVPYHRCYLCQTGVSRCIGDPPECQWKPTVDFPT